MSLSLNDASHILYLSILYACPLLTGDPAWSVRQGNCHGFVGKTSSADLEDEWEKSCLQGNSAAAGGVPDQWGVQWSRYCAEHPTAVSCFCFAVFFVLYCAEYIAAALKVLCWALSWCCPCWGSSWRDFWELRRRQKLMQPCDSWCRYEPDAAIGQGGFEKWLWWYCFGWTDRVRKNAYDHKGT